jgi:hypothetical protein
VGPTLGGAAGRFGFLGVTIERGCGVFGGVAARPSPWKFAILFVSIRAAAGSATITIPWAQTSTSMRSFCDQPAFETSAPGPELIELRPLERLSVVATETLSPTRRVCAPCPCLASRARQVRTTDPGTAMGIALEALPDSDAGMTRPYVPEAAAALKDAWDHRRQRLTLSGHRDPLHRAAFSPTANAL